MDNTLFFGSCVVLNMENGVVADMSVKDFEDIMEHLYGGFEDIGSEDDDEDDDDDDTDSVDLPKTKEGYVKDDFIVDSDEEESEESDESESEEEIVKPKRKSAPKPKASSSQKKQTNIIIECSDELEEEEYLPM